MTTAAVDLFRDAADDLAALAEHVDRRRYEIYAKRLRSLQKLNAAMAAPPPPDPASLCYVVLRNPWIISPAWDRPTALLDGDELMADAPEQPSPADQGGAAALRPAVPAPFDRLTVILPHLTAEPAAVAEVRQLYVWGSAATAYAERHADPECQTDALMLAADYESAALTLAEQYQKLFTPQTAVLTWTELLNRAATRYAGWLAALQPVL